MLRKLFFLSVMVIGLWSVYHYWYEPKVRRENAETIGAEWEESQKDSLAPKAEVKVAWIPSGMYAKAKGKSIIELGTDASASMTKEAQAKQEAMMDSITARVSGDNLLSLYTMGSKVYRHNTGSSDAGRAGVLKNWKEFLPYKQDSLFTNCTAALAAMISDAIPLIEQGYVAEVVLVTDGKHEPPPGQDDEDIKWEIENALTGIPAEFRNRLRVDIVEVGKLLQYSGQVAALLPSGFATTRRADSWDDVLPIVLDLQKRIEGRYGWVNAPANAYNIGAPSEESPKMLGPFSFSLSGPDKATVQVDLATNDLVDSSEQLVLEASVDNGDWIRLTRDQITLADNSTVRFRFFENSQSELPSNWFDIWQREYTVKIQPIGNLIPLVQEGEAVKVRVEKPAFIWELGAWLVVIGLIGFGSCVFLLFWAIRFLRRHYEQPGEVEEPFSRPVANIAFGHEAQTLQSGASITLGQIVFTASADGLEVALSPLVPVRVEYTDLALMKKVRQALVPSETFTLNPETEARIISLTGGLEYSVTPTTDTDITPIMNMLLTTGG